MRSSLKYTTFIALFFQWATTCFPQSIGPNPNHQNWQIIRTESVNIIFPQGMEPAATRTMQLINYQHDSLLIGVGKKTKKVNIILQNTLVESNGFVATAPFRSAFFSTAPQSTNFLGTTD